MQPVVVKKEGFFIVGVEVSATEGFFVIGNAWGELFLRKQEIINIKTPEKCFGYEDYSRDFDFQKMNFYYTASYEVENLDSIPEGMKAIYVPESNYAVFTHKGPVEGIDKTFRNIYDDWLPKSGYTFSDKVNADFECYDERWESDQIIDIYIPILEDVQ